MLLIFLGPAVALVIVGRAVAWAVRQDRADRLEASFRYLIQDLPAFDWPTPQEYPTPEDEAL